MKRILFTTILTVAVVVTTSAQTPKSTPFSERVAANQGALAGDPELPRFSLEFPGGTPDELAEAIREKIGTLNVIVPTEYKNEKLPSLKLHNVNVRQLFEALEMASQKKVFPSGGTGQSTTTSMGFRATGVVRPETVWYFYADRAAAASQPKLVRYYQLAPYLSKYKLDDITTAIQAGWKMLGENKTPELNYHQDTKLLIAVGQMSDLVVIDSVLSELNRGLRAESAHQSAPAGQPAAAPAQSGSVTR